MTDLLALHRAVLEYPHDDAVRMIYADCLEESGESERAEFIRVQVELARSARPCPQGIANAEVGYKSPHNCFMCSGNGGMIYDCDNPKELRRRERELLAGPAGRFDIDTTRIWPVKVSRGFISAITCSWSDFQRHAPALLWWPGSKCDECHGTELGAKSPPWKSCSACRGTGELPGAEMPCPTCVKGNCIACKGNGHRYGRRYPTMVSGNCRACDGTGNCDTCSGSGRVPVSLTLQHQPVTEVTLTTWPDISTSNWTHHDSSSRERWPSVQKWNLPPGDTFPTTANRPFAEFREQLIADVTRGLILPPNVIGSPTA